VHTCSKRGGGARINPLPKFQHTIPQKQLPLPKLTQLETPISQSDICDDYLKKQNSPKLID
jgi:hypothetical protein